MGVYINDDELVALGSLSPNARCAYIWLRSRMDWSTGLVGRTSKISYYAIGEWLDYEVPKGQGTVLMRVGDTTQKIKDAGLRLCEQLERVGLLAKRTGCAVLTFFCPKASLQGQVRPFQTNHERTTQLSTERTAQNEASGFSESSVYAGFGGSEIDWRHERTTPDFHKNGPNGPHIIERRCTPPQSSSTDSTGVVPPGDERGGVSRDRAAPSQDGSLGRPVDTPEDLYRDRPLGASQAGPLERPSHNGNESHRDRAAPSEVRGPTQQPVPNNSQGRGDPPVLSAENESAPLGVSAGADDPEQALREVLRVHAVRVLPKDAPGLAEWVRMRVLPAELAEVVKIAIGLRLADGSMQRLNVGYLHSILLTQRSDARKAAQGAKTQKSMRYSQSGLIALAAQLGIPPARAGEEPEAFRIRVMTAHAARGAEGG